MYTLKGGKRKMECYGSSCCGSSRQFLTRAEKIQLLTDYKAQLDKESKGVAERLAQLQTTDDSDE